MNFLAGEGLWSLFEFLPVEFPTLLFLRSPGFLDSDLLEDLYLSGDLLEGLYLPGEGLDGLYLSDVDGLFLSSLTLTTAPDLMADRRILAAFSS